MMIAQLVTFDFFEQAMLMMGWLISNSITDVFQQSGMALIPFVVLVVKEWYEAKDGGEEAGNKGVLSANRVEMGLYIKLIVYIFTVLPMFSVSFAPININHQYASDCGVATVVAPAGQWEATTVNMIGGATVNIPAWWGLVHALSHGLTNVAVGAIPCTPDIQSIATEVDLSSIEDPALQQELSHFQRQCFGTARSMVYQAGATITPAVAEDIDWIGSTHFLTTVGFYDSIQSDQPVPGFAYNATRDAALPHTGAGLPGYPTCKQWWSTAGVGLKARLSSQINPSIWTHVNAVFTSATATDSVIRRLVSPRSGAANGNSNAIGGYRNSNQNLLGAVQGTVAATGGVVGSALVAIPFMAGMDMAKQALPMVQFIMIMAIVISLPFVSLLSSYSVSVVGTATIGLFSIWFLTFWWQAARWLSANLVDLLYNSEATKLSYLAGVTNAYDIMVLQFVEGAAFFFLPAVWVMALTWAGFKGGSAISSAASSGSNDAKSAGNTGGSAVTSKGASAAK
jgi:hypothetical protein